MPVPEDVKAVQRFLGAVHYLAKFLRCLFGNRKKTSQFKMICKDDSGYVTQLKQQKSKGDIT